MNTWIVPPIILAYLCMYIFQGVRCSHMILFVQMRLQINEMLIFRSTWRAFVQRYLLSQHFHASNFHFSSYITIISIFYFLYPKLFPYHIQFVHCFLFSSYILTLFMITWMPNSLTISRFDCLYERKQQLSLFPAPFSIINDIFWDQMSARWWLPQKLRYVRQKYHGKHRPREALCLLIECISAAMCRWIRKKVEKI